ncbi:MAG: helix-turn-helix domain-containing protein [Acetatifactor sp.]|nr:helix-turn-helix domain-containing protein [Acetatifactor sp.]
MRNNSLGDVIRSLRKKAGLSQEELADGICSPVSVSRIENGAQMPSGMVLEALLARLGTSTYQICDIYYKSEKQQEFEQEAEEVSRLLSEGKLEDAKDCLARLESGARADSLNLQCYLLLYASIKIYEGENSEEVLSILYDALAQTKASFDFEDFRNVLLSVSEANILNVIAAVLFRLEDVTGAIRLGEELMSSLKRHKSGLKEYTIVQINLAINLAQFLEKEHRYKEALVYIETAEELSFSSFEQALLPEIEFIKAKMYHLLGNDSDCTAILKAVVPYMELVRKTDFAGLVRGYAEKELGIII